MCLRFDAFYKSNGVLLPICPPVYSHTINNLSKYKTCFMLAIVGENVTFFTLFCQFRNKFGALISPELVLVLFYCVFRERTYWRAQDRQNGPLHQSCQRRTRDIYVSGASYKE